MNKTKLLAVAAGFLAAAGLTTAGNIYIGGEKVGEFVGTGTIELPGTITYDGSDNGNNGNETEECTGDNEVWDGSECVCESGYELNFNHCVPVDNNDNNDDNDNNGGSTPADCSNVPEAGTRDFSWTSFDQFPGPVGAKDDEFTVENGRYLAVELTAPTANQFGYMSTQANSHATNNQHTMAISRCPGDFDQTRPVGLCKKSSASQTFWWATYPENYVDPESGTIYKQVGCMLKPGETYYLNIKYAKPNNLNVSTCEHAHKCGALMSYSH